MQVEIDQHSLGCSADSSVRAKLLRSTILVLLLVCVATLGCIAVAQYGNSSDAAHRTERRVVRNQREKGVLLVSNQAIALRGLALENAFSDVAELVRRTVKEDQDVIYGSYVDAEGAPWIIVTPQIGERGETGGDARPHLADVPGLAEREPDSKPHYRTLNAFGEPVDEHSIAVLDGSEYLGTIRYGFSLASTKAALKNDLDVAQRSLVRLLILVALLGIAGIGLGTIAIWRIAASIAEPLSILTHASEELAKGNRHFRADVRSGDELERLATTFNAMADANQRTMTELEVKTAEALESSRLKSEFLANMSHEIRTPMNGILGVVRLIHRMPLEHKLRRYVETIDSSASALLTIINDVLDFSKIEAGKYAINNVSCDLHTVVQEVCELFAPRAYERGVDLVCQLDPTMSSLHEVDPDRFRQVISNLIGNAIKFTERGEIIVEVRIAERTDRTETLHVAVVDTGIGIAQSDLPRLFSAFSQVNGSMVRRYGGTGLGLAISKRLVDFMGGSMGVKSVPGEGSEFFFTLTLPFHARDDRIQDAWAQGKAALLVEQHPRWQEVIAEHLQAWGVVATSYASAAEALEYLQEPSRRRPDIVIASTQTADMRFDDFIGELRRLESMATVPIVALYQMGVGLPLSNIEKELVAQIPKPLRFSELYNVIQQAIVGSSVLATKATSSGSMPIGEGNCVLVVNDNEVNRFVAQEMLEQMGFTVNTAQDGAEGLEQIKAQSYLVVLMDCQMPVMDGYTAVRELRKWEQTSGTRTTVVALTAHALSGEREKVLAAGMDDYLAKPVRPASLEKLMRRYAALRSTTDRFQPAQSLRRVESEPPLLDANTGRSRKLIQLFLGNMPNQLTVIRKAIDSGVAADTRACAHKTKGSCLALGASKMASVAERLQNLAETGSLEGSRDIAAELEQQFAGVAAELSKELGNDQSDEPTSRTHASVPAQNPHSNDGRQWRT